MDENRTDSSSITISSETMPGRKLTNRRPPIETLYDKQLVNLSPQEQHAIDVALNNKTWALNEARTEFNRAIADDWYESAATDSVVKGVTDTTSLEEVILDGEINTTTSWETIQLGGQTGPGWVSHWFRNLATHDETRRKEKINTHARTKADVIMETGTKEERRRLPRIGRNLTKAHIQTYSLRTREALAAGAIYNPNQARNLLDERYLFWQEVLQEFTRQGDRPDMVRAIAESAKDSALDALDSLIEGMNPEIKLANGISSENAKKNYAQLHLQEIKYAYETLLTALDSNPNLVTELKKLTIAAYDFNEGLGSVLMSFWAERFSSASQDLQIGLIETCGSVLSIGIEKYGWDEQRQNDYVKGLGFLVNSLSGQDLPDKLKQALQKLFTKSYQTLIDRQSSQKVLEHAMATKDITDLNVIKLVASQDHIPITIARYAGKHLSQESKINKEDITKIWQTLGQDLEDSETKVTIMKDLIRRMNGDTEKTSEEKSETATVLFKIDFGYGQTVELETRHLNAINSDYLDIGLMPVRLYNFSHPEFPDNLGDDEGNMEWIDRVYGDMLQFYHAPHDLRLFIAQEKKYLDDIQLLGQLKDKLQPEDINAIKAGLESYLKDRLEMFQENQAIILLLGINTLRAEDVHEEREFKGPAPVYPINKLRSLLPLIEEWVGADFVNDVKNETTISILQHARNEHQFFVGIVQEFAQKLVDLGKRDPGLLGKTGQDLVTILGLSDMSRQLGFRQIEDLWTEIEKSIWTLYKNLRYGLDTEDLTVASRIFKRLSGVTKIRQTVFKGDIDLYSPTLQAVIRNIRNISRRGSDRHINDFAFLDWASMTADMSQKPVGERYRLFSGWLETVQIVARELKLPLS